MARDKRPLPIVRMERGRLVPASAYDAEALAALPDGTEFDARPRTKRSLPQHRLYWQALTRAVEATGRWQSPEALHTAIKVELGYVEPIFGLDGKVKGMIPESTSFAKMPAHEFRDFMDRAMQALGAAIGADPLDGLAA